MKPKNRKCQCKKRKGDQIDYRKTSSKKFRNNAKGEIYFEDARKIDPEELPDIDLICGGFPCRSYPEKIKIPK